MINKYFILLIIIVSTNGWLHDTFEKHLIHSAVERNALCNDGTPSGGYFSPGIDDGANKWIIYFTGGRWCWDNESCKNTYGRMRGTIQDQYISSRNWPDTEDFIGLMSPSPQINDFHNWNRIYVKYCTSDIYSGNANNENDIGYYFHGDNVVYEMLKDFMDSKIVKSNNTINKATHMIISGSSAGGLGVMIHLTRIANMFPNTIVKGFNDAGWLIPLETVYKDGSEIFSEEIMHGIELWKPVLPFNCLAFHKNDKHFCFTPNVLYRHARQIPLYIALNIPDGFIAYIANSINYPPNKEDEIEWINNIEDV